MNCPKTVVRGTTVGLAGPLLHSLLVGWEGGHLISQCGKQDVGLDLCHVPAGLF